MEELMNIREVSRILGISTTNVIDLVIAGEIQAYKVLGTPVDKDYVDYDTRGLRFRPTDIRKYLSAVLIK